MTIILPATALHEGHELWGYIRAIRYQSPDGTDIVHVQLRFDKDTPPKWEPFCILTIHNSKIIYQLVRKAQPYELPNQQSQGSAAPATADSVALPTQGDDPAVRSGQVGQDEQHPDAPESAGSGN